VTVGPPTVTDVHPAPGWGGADATDRLLTLVASLESRSEHPLAAAIVSAAVARGLDVMAPELFESVTGLGAHGVVDGHGVVVGSAALLTHWSVSSTPVQGVAERLATEGRTAVYVAVDGTLAGVLGVADPIKPGAAAAVARLAALGLHVVMLTGDAEHTAHAIARQAGIAHVVAGVLPDGKVAEVRRLQERGPVAMVGDGINDAPALAQADVGLAIGTGTDIAVEAADVVLMRGELAGVAQAITLSRRTTRTMRQNLFWAFVYNVIGIPVAAGVLYPAFGLLLSPILASAAMAMSSVSVVGNSLRLRGARLD
jgi:Cu+-exporting ATPase